MWNPVGSSSSSGANNKNDQVSTPPTRNLSEDELERQYLSYKSQFEEWIEKNRNHPDRDAYDRYVRQFEEWEAQVERNRQAIRAWKKKKADQQEKNAINTTTNDFAGSTAAKNRKNERSTTASVVTAVAAATTNSEASSPPSAANTAPKKKKVKKSKKKKQTAAAADDQSVVAATLNAEIDNANPMMAMMKMMATTMAAANNSPLPPAAPVQQPSSMPMDPMSMMMAMTMMMPLLMTSPAPAPPPPTAPSSTLPPARPQLQPAVAAAGTTRTTTLPDMTRPPPGFGPAAGPSSLVRQAKGEQLRDRAFRADRAATGSIVSTRPAPPADEQTRLRISRQGGWNGDRPAAEEDDRGDYWYHRWLANRHHSQQPGQQPTVDPWLPAHRPQTQQQAFPPTHQAGGSVMPPPVPLWPSPQQQQQMQRTLDRASFLGDDPAGGGPQYFSTRSINLGARDFSMRKQQRNWD